MKKCVNCGRRIWLDVYGPGWVHWRGGVWCYGVRPEGLYATPGEIDSSGKGEGREA